MISLQLRFWTFRIDLCIPVPCYPFPWDL